MSPLGSWVDQLRGVFSTVSCNFSVGLWPSCPQWEPDHSAVHTPSVRGLLSGLNKQDRSQDHMQPPDMLYPEMYGAFPSSPGKAVREGFSVLCSLLIW